MTIISKFWHSWGFTSCNAQTQHARETGPFTLWNDEHGFLVNTTNETTKMVG